MLRPKSRGCIKLRSRNPYEHPLIDPNYLSHPDDVATLVDGMKLAIQFGSSSRLRSKFNARFYDSPLPGCEMHTFMSDKYLECTARMLTWTLWHPHGTCKMVCPYDDKDASGVVDNELRVLGGIKGLRVVDASVIPTAISGKQIPCSQPPRPQRAITNRIENLSPHREYKCSSDHDSRTRGGSHPFRAAIAK